MKKKEFYEQIKDILLIDENINENTGIVVDSMASLLLIAFFDENFSVTIPHHKIKTLEKISDLVELVGEKLIE